jgi:hypothetical protein
MFELLKKLNLFLSISQKLKILITLLLDLFIQFLSLVNILMIFPILNFVINIESSSVNSNFSKILLKLSSFSLKEILIFMISIFIAKECLLVISKKIKLKFQAEIISDLTCDISNIILLNLNKIKIESTLRILDGEIKICYRFIESMFLGIYNFFLVVIFMISSFFIEEKFTVIFFLYMLIVNLIIIIIFEKKSKKIGLKRYKLSRIINKFILDHFKKKSKSIRTKNILISKKVSEISKEFYIKVSNLILYKQIQRSLNFILSAVFLIFYFSNKPIDFELAVYIPILVLIVKASEYLSQVQNNFSSMTYQSQSFLKIEKIMSQFKKF